MVEQSAVNRWVVGSSPTSGASSSLHESQNRYSIWDQDCALIGVFAILRESRFAFGARIDARHADHAFVRREPWGPGSNTA